MMLRAEPFRNQLDVLGAEGLRALEGDSTAIVLVDLVVGGRVGEHERQEMMAKPTPCRAGRAI
jgi:hypothetical protein